MLKKILDIIGDNTPVLDIDIKGECSVCGRLTDNGIKFNKLYSKSTFNQNHFFKNMKSDVICNYCAVFFKKEYWIDYCLRNNKSPYFPKVDGKEPYPANWVFFSHLFSRNNHQIITNRHDWRTYLLITPEPPFCFVLSTLCKKHLIYRAEISYCSDNYPIQFEEKRIYINKWRFKKCLTTFEKLYSMGLSKSTIVSGDYNSSALLKCDKEIFIESENIIKEFRMMNISYLEICEFIGKKHE